jgi:hypothetical protein
MRAQRGGSYILRIQQGILGLPLPHNLIHRQRLAFRSALEIRMLLGIVSEILRFSTIIRRCRAPGAEPDGLPRSKGRSLFASEATN